MIKNKTMKIKFVTLFTLTTILMFNFNPVFSQKNGNNLLKKMDNTMFAIKDKTADIKMVLTNLSNRKEKIKLATIIQKDANKKIFRYTYPKVDSGIATLSLPNNEIYLYLPLFKKPKKITSIAEGNTFNQSDFSVEDMATKKYSEKYLATLTGSNDSAYILKLTPKSPDTQYSYLTLFLNKKFFYPEKFEFYNLKGRKVKESVFHFIKIDGYWVSDKVSMINLKKKHSTSIIMTNIKINQGLKDTLFTVDNLAGK